MSGTQSPRVRPKAEPVVRRRRRKSFSSAKASRWLVRIVVVTVALALGCSVGCKILRPFRLVGDEKRQKAQIVSDYVTLKKQNQQLQWQLHYLKTPEGIAQEARKQGFVKPGEISLVIPE